MTIKLTENLVKSLPVPQTGSAVYKDTDLRGFGVRVYPSGKRTFFLSYWPAPKSERRVVIGDHSEALKVTAARKLAQKRKFEIQHGGADPAAEKRRRREAPTVTDLCERYIEGYARERKRERSVEEDQSMIRLFVRPELGQKKVSDVTPEDVDRLHHKVTHRKVEHDGKRHGGPTRANRVLSVLSKMFSLSIRWGWRPDNPVRGIERNREERREKFLSDAEMTSLLEALGRHQSRTAARALIFLLLTGARKGETLSATWDQFDLDNGVWTKPSAHTKQKKAHRVPLSGPALDLLREMREEAKKLRQAETTTLLREEQAYVFPGKRPGRSLEGLRSTWVAVCEKAGISNCRIHDLRHAFASVLANSGVDIRTLGGLLGHTQIATTMRYSHLYDDALREGVEVMGRVFEKASKRERAEVVPMKSVKD